MKITVAETKAQMGSMAAEDAAAKIVAAIAERGEARVIFASAASQFEFLEALVAHGGIDWSKVHGFHLDEYVGLKADHPASFRRFLRERSTLPASASAKTGTSRSTTRRRTSRRRRHTLSLRWTRSVAASRSAKGGIPTSTTFLPMPSR